MLVKHVNQKNNKRANRIQKSSKCFRTMRKIMTNFRSVSPGERFVVILFGFVPMIIGYIFIIKFIISIL